MIVLFHILVALGSIVSTTYVAFNPSNLTLYVSYGLVVVTLASGTYLTILNPSHLLQTCATGIIYISAVSAGLVFTRKKLYDISS